jgi:ribose transport system substrate-binding protein
VIVGIDANPQALDAIAAGGSFEASVAQDFTGIGSSVAEQVNTVLSGGEVTRSVIYVPTVLVTGSNVAEFITEAVG